ncbi:putative long-chain-fatty-acid--CoA ligase [Helianthus annuus]|uniref:Long-chain-fatty-acid--CoA ligase n=1 Tax=Helianthus annuus TaxID=4232 RepID=A0A9K3P2G7_HELAN|nr:long chain acyl-CoA synthetase 1-like [Helianthus annuus]XP_035832691.1 long chain acyl-CoA synthetase 1-like [Helianthus annuus]XP_035832692.1 long chain acyl-CoA synthetase 1-like [Helianthus annuus]XP_035832693.1 long chain acyl-CoA synthetase 1-like [Helianthus annuus]XP_035832694.1 long chain acyl-CoA synthetase 1-like [Helianthus annuus]XP_035832695.1 long chain acyl-CoA synthetase 1-like [Helianthus annuus]XP_035832696.1 long chain acyl-CoA synthetase 1-like [Helianthus annuus]KAF5
MLRWSEFVDGKWGPYLWKSYKTVYEEVLNAVAALRASGIGPGCKVGIYGASCPQLIVAMEAMPRVTFLCLYMIPLDQERSALYWTMPKLMLFLSKIKKLNY